MLLLWIGLLKAVGSPSIVDCVDACINVESAVWQNKWETCQICCIGDPFSNPLHCHVFCTGEQNLQSISNSLSSNLSLILAFQNFHFLLIYQGLFQFTLLHHNWPGSMCNWHCCTANDALEDPKNIYWMGCTTTGVVWHHLHGNHNYCTKWSPSQWRLLMVPCCLLGLDAETHKQRIKLKHSLEFHQGITGNRLCWNQIKTQQMNPRNSLAAWTSWDKNNKETGLKCRMGVLEITLIILTIMLWDSKCLQSIQEQVWTITLKHCGSEYWFTSKIQFTYQR
jgi:hypothetical protein